MTNSEHRLRIDLDAPEGGRWLCSLLGEGVSILSMERLSTTTSSTIVRVGVQHRQQMHWAALRLFDHRQWLAESPDAPAREAQALQFAQHCGLPAPELIGYSPRDVGFGAPCLLMTWLEGEVVVAPPALPPWCEGLAKALAAIHQQQTVGQLPFYRSWVNPNGLAPPSWSRSPALWQEAIARWHAGPPPFTPCLIHRDFHPTNVLWRHSWAGSAVSGVVDWPNACAGPALLDVAHCSWNLALMHGMDAVYAFRDAYTKANPLMRCALKHGSYWDLDSLLDKSNPGGYYAPWRAFGLPEHSESLLQTRVEEFLAFVLR